MFNALVAAREFKEAGDGVRLAFGGAATKWPRVLVTGGYQVITF